jgi:hypothetical protein
MNPLRTSDLPHIQVTTRGRLWSVGGRRRGAHPIGLANPTTSHRGRTRRPCDRTLQATLRTGEITRERPPASASAPPVNSGSSAADKKYCTSAKNPRRLAMPPDRALNRVDPRKEIFFADPVEVREVLVAKVGNLFGVHGGTLGHGVPAVRGHLARGSVGPAIQPGSARADP